MADETQLDETVEDETSTVAVIDPPVEPDAERNAVEDDMETRDPADGDGPADGMETCPTCKGTGKVNGNTTECPDCGGSGEVEARAADDPEMEQRTAAWVAKERRKARAEMVDGMPERRYWQPTWGPIGLELRQDGNGIVHVGGYASITEVWYEVGDYEERATRGSFKRSLGEKPDVMFLANHADMPLARTKTTSLDIGEDQRGYRYMAELQEHDPDVQRLMPKLQRQDMDESSFAFRARDQEWDADYRKRSLIDIGLHKGDVSVVNHGANPATTAALRGLADFGMEQLGEALVEMRAGKAISSKNESEIKDSIAKLEGLLAKPEESAPEPVLGVGSDPLAVIIPSGIEAARAAKAKAEERKA